MGFTEKTDYLIETKSLLKDRINSLGGSITSGTTFRDYLVWLDSLYEALDKKTITGLPDSLEGKCEQEGEPTPDNPIPVDTRTGRQVVSVCGKNLLPNNATTQTINGITYTINEDKTIKVNGTANGRADLYLYGSSSDNGEYLYIPKGNYTLNIQNITNGTMFYAFREKTAGTRYQTNTNNGVIELLAQQDCYFYGVMLAVESGKTITNMLIYPQLEKGQPTTYEEYIGNDYEINLGKNLVNALDTSSMINFTKTDDVFKTSALTSTGYGGIATTTFTNSVPIMKNGIGYFSADIRLVSGTTSIINYIGDKALTRANQGWVSNHTLSNEFQRYCFKYDVSMGTSFTGFAIQLYNCNNAVIEVKNIMFSYSSDLDYSPYKTPIYLGKIGNYKDYIVKTSGKNLFDKDNAIIKNGYGKDANGNEVVNVSGNYTTSYTQVKPNTTYTFSYKLSSVVARIYLYDIEKNWIGRTDNIINSSNKFTFTTPNNCYYLQFQNVINFINGDTQLEEGNQKTYYEPYGEGQWYIHKEIGRVVYDGSDDEAWSYLNNYDNNYLYQSLGVNLDIENYSTNYLCTHALPNSTTSSSGNIGSYVFNKAFRLRVPSSIATTSGAFKTWLSSHNVEVYYVLATPTNTLIEDEELINQLNEIEIFTVISEDFYN